MPFLKSAFAALFTASLVCLAEPPIASSLSKPVLEGLDRVSPESMKGHLSFLSSDLLEGRDTPSRGLDIAAEYIAAQFRRAGLEEAPGTSSYFQIAKWKYKSIAMNQVALTFENGGTRIALDGSRFTIPRLQARDTANAVVFKVKLEDKAKLKEMADGSLAGKAILFEAPTQGEIRKLPETERRDRMREWSEFHKELPRLKPDAAIIVRRGERGGGSGGQLSDPQAKQQPRGFPPNAAIAVYSNELADAFAPLPFGETGARISLHVPEPIERDVALKNVIGVLPGSDPVLKNTYILVTAHYDHIGMTAPENGDGIYNGANDDGSGTVSVIEIASAMAALKQRPKRTIVFMTVWGEEKGLLGAFYYSRNPVFPLAKTVANINLEHMGRTDSSEGPQLNRASITGFDFSDVSTVFEAAGQMSGVDFYKHPTDSDVFFNRSDNLAFAQFGIPAHTFCVAFEFPDYHGLGDHWDKVDYENMARVGRSVAAGIWMLGDWVDEPKWNESNDKTEKYRTARKPEGNKAAP